MSNSFRGIQNGSDAMEAASAARLQVSQTDFTSKDRSNEMIKTLGEAKSAISGKGLVDKVVGNIKKAAVKKAKAVLQDVKDKANQAIKDGLEKGKSAIKDGIEKGKSTVKDTIQKGKSSAEDTLKNAGKRGSVEDSGLQESARGVAPKMEAPLENVSAEEADLTRTSQAASRGEQFSQEMSSAREAGDVGLTGGEDSLRVGQAAGKEAADAIPGPPPGVGGSTEAEMRAGSFEGQAKQAAAKGVEDDTATAAEKEAAQLAEKKVATAATEKVVGKAVVKGAEEGGEIVAEGGGPEDVVGDAIGIAVGVGTTLYSIFKKPHNAIANLPVSEASQSFQVGF
tara:strand:+ start:756 stop:1772 length:1017 start_codon:yes stop_codon:yes gene_type:complete